jgi:hypothetical protein
MLNRQGVIGLVAVVSVALVACATAIKHGDSVTLIATTVKPVASEERATLARQQWEPGGKAYKLHEHTIVMPSDCDDDRARRLLHATGYIYSGFEHDYGRLQGPCLIFITDKEVFQMETGVLWFPPMPPGVPQMPKRQFVNITGVCCGSSEIAIVAGDSDSLPSLYHEFCHVQLDGTPDHRDRRWDKWNQRGKELSEQIIKFWR